VTYWVGSAASTKTGLDRSYAGLSDDGPGQRARAVCVRGRTKEPGQEVEIGDGDGVFRLEDHG